MRTIFRLAIGKKIVVAAISGCLLANLQASSFAENVGALPRAAAEISERPTGRLVPASEDVLEPALPSEIVNSYPIPSAAALGNPQEQVPDSKASVFLMPARQTSIHPAQDTRTSIQAANKFQTLEAADIEQMPLETLSGDERQVWDGNGEKGTGSKPLNAPSLRPETFIPARELSYWRISPWRALSKHSSFSDWQGRNVFQAPRVSTDHQILSLLSYAAYYPFILLAAAAAAQHYFATVLLELAVTGIFGTGLALSHFQEASDAQGVVRNAKRYVESPSNVTWDDELMRLVKKFQKETGWSVVWTDDRYLLAKAELESRRVILNLGWVIKSADARDRRRLAYLNDTLHRIRRAITQSVGLNGSQAAG